MPRDTTLYTSAARLLETHRDWSQHQDRVMQVDWCTTWTYADFCKWFADCLNSKINRTDPRATWRKMQSDYQNAQARDARIIKQFYAERVVRSGVNILTTPELQRRYPQINTPARD